MKKIILAIIFAVSSVSFAQIVDNTTIANMIQKGNKLNGLKNPDLIFPQQRLLYPFPSDMDITPVYVEDGQSQWKIVKGMYRDYFNTPQLKLSVVPTVPVSPLPPEVKNDYLGWFLFAFGIVILVLAYIIHRLVEKNKNIKEHDDRMLKERNKVEEDLWETERELQATKNMLPIVPPATGVDEKWLEENNPEGKSISGDEPEEIVENFSRVYGKKPDYIVKAKVKTKGNGTNLGYSFGRTAITILNDVTAFIAWNMNGENLEEVGFIIGSCANRFQSSPQEIRKIDEMFEFKLSDINEHPVVFKSQNVPGGQACPKLVKGLIVEYHNNSILDLENAGVQIIIDPAPIASVKTRKSKKATK